MSGWLPRLIMRELRHIRGFIVFVACLTLGITAIVAVNVLDQAVQEGVARDSIKILGGDISINTVNVPLKPDEFEQLVPSGSQTAQVIRTNAMLSKKGDDRLVVALKAVGDLYPLYGNVELDSGMDLRAALADGGLVLERGAVLRLGLNVGDDVMVSGHPFTLRDIILTEPDQTGGPISIGPRAMISLADLERYDMLVEGSLARYAWKIRLPDQMDPKAFADDLKATWPDSRWTVQTLDDVAPMIKRFTDRLATYLTLAGVTTLIIGGIGVAFSVQNYLRAREQDIAMLKCVGLTSTDIFKLFGAQIGVMVLIGVTLGIMLGQIVPMLSRFIPAGLLPFTLEIGIVPSVWLLAACAGVLIAAAFSWLSLSRAGRSSPASLFRARIGDAAGELRWYDGLAVVLLLGLLILLIASSVSQPDYAFYFAGIAIVATLVLLVTSKVFLTGLGRMAAQFGLYLRMAARGVSRPGSGAMSVISAMGAGLSVLIAVALVQSNMSTEVSGRLKERAPSLFFIDIQPDQKDPFKEVVTQYGDEALTAFAPILRGRVLRIDGVPVHEVSIGRGSRWTLRRDRGLSFSAEKPASARVVEGEWWDADYAGDPLVSVTREVAEDYGVAIGDTLTFDVLGRPVTATIANLREVEWESAQMNFVFVLSPEPMQRAPHTSIATVKVSDDDETSLIRQIADILSNVTPISLREIIRTISDALSKISLAVNAVGGVTLLAGLFVLAGAIAATRNRHRYEAVVMKTLGATRRELLTIFVLEYATLGVLAAVVATFIGTVGSWFVVDQLMNFEWTFNATPVILVNLAAIMLTLVGGFIGTWRVLGESAASILRLESR